MNLGDIAKDKITGFEGVVVARTRHLSNIDTWTLQPKGTKDGKPLGSVSFDEGRVVFVKKSDIRVLPIARADEPVELGDTVKVPISGIKGVVTAISEWSEGCSILRVQPKELHEGQPVDAIAADERNVEVITRANPKPKKVTTGGPRPEPMRGRAG